MNQRSITQDIPRIQIVRPTLMLSPMGGFETAFTHYWIIAQAYLMPVFLLSDELSFPPPFLSSKEGLLAIGGDLSKDRLILAYRNGIFPWYSDGEPILWWSPDPRLVLFPSQLHVSRSLNKILKKKLFSITMDTAFERVIRNCADVRTHNGPGTWITREMAEAYVELHQSGYAHSVEVWQKKMLVGGLYGVSLGRSFFGESMFSKASNASKVALVSLVAFLRTFDFDLIDCQIKNDHLVRLGASEIPRKQFLRQLDVSLKKNTLKGDWGHYFLNQASRLSDEEAGSAQ